MKMGEGMGRETGEGVHVGERGVREGGKWRRRVNVRAKLVCWDVLAGWVT